MDATGEMAAAVEAAMSAATPAASTESTEQSQAPATSASQTDSTTAATQTPEAEPGPVPYARFKEVNESAKRYEEQLKGYAWIKPEHQTELQRFYQRVTGENPLDAYLDELGQLVASRPDFAGPLKSWAARTLGTRAQQQAETVEPDLGPQPDIPLEDGRAVYSAQQLQKREQWLEKQWESKFDAKLQPLQTVANEQKAAAIFAKVQAESQAAGLKDVEAMKSKPHFDELRSEMRTRMMADPDLTLREAYNVSFLEKIVPQYAAGKAAVLQQKVGASSANPSRPSGAVSKPSTDIREETARVMAAMTGR